MIDSVLTQGTVERSIIDGCLLKEFDGIHWFPDSVYERYNHKMTLLLETWN